MQTKTKDKKRKLSSISCTKNDKMLAKDSGNIENTLEKSYSKKMPKYTSLDKRKIYQKMDIRTLNKNVQKNKEVCKNCYIHYDNSKSSYILTFINRKQKKQRKLFPVKPNEKDEAYITQIMNYIDKLKDQEKIFGISKNDEMAAPEGRDNNRKGGGGRGGSTALGEFSFDKNEKVVVTQMANNMKNPLDGKGKKPMCDNGNNNSGNCSSGKCNKDQVMQKKNMSKDSYTDRNLSTKKEMCTSNLNLLNKKMNTFLSGINDQMYIQPNMNYISDPHPHIQMMRNINNNRNGTKNPMNIYEDINNIPPTVDFMHFNNMNDGYSFENFHLMNPRTSNAQNLDLYFKNNSKKEELSKKKYMNEQYNGERNTTIDRMNNNVRNDMNSNNRSCLNTRSSINKIVNIHSNQRSSRRINLNTNNTTHTSNLYENAMMNQNVKNILHACGNNQTVNPQKKVFGSTSGSGSGSTPPINTNDEFGSMNIFSNTNFSIYHNNMPTSCENEIINKHNSLVNDYAESMLDESNRDTMVDMERTTAGTSTM